MQLTYLSTITTLILPRSYHTQAATPKVPDCLTRTEWRCLQPSQPAHKLSSIPLPPSITSGPTKPSRSRPSSAPGKMWRSLAASPIAQDPWGRCPSARFRSGARSMKTERWHTCNSWKTLLDRPTASKRGDRSSMLCSKRTERLRFDWTWDWCSGTVFAEHWISQSHVMLHRRCWSPRILASWGTRPWDTKSSTVLRAAHYVRVAASPKIPISSLKGFQFISTGYHAVQIPKSSSVPWRGNHFTNETYSSLNPRQKHAWRIFRHWNRLSFTILAVHVLSSDAISILDLEVAGYEASWAPTDPSDGLK